MKRTLLLPLLGFFAWGISHAAEKPNILWIITDDQRPDSIAAFNRIRYGGTNSLLGSVLSPNVDRLAALGTTFINTFNQNPSCAPSRTSMHTGRYSHRTGVYGFEYYNPSGQAFWKPMVPEILRDEAGYQTISVGKLGIRDQHFANKKRKSAGPLLYETDLGYREEFAAKGLVEWNPETKWSGGKQGPKTEYFFLPDGTRLAWPEEPDATPNDSKEIQKRFGLFRDYHAGGGSAGGEEGGPGEILGGLNPKPAGQTRDASFEDAVLNHLAHAGQSYTDVLGREQQGPDPRKPVFIHCGFEFPHTPVLPPAEFREKFAGLMYKIPGLAPEERAGFPPQIEKAFKNWGSDHFTDAEKQQMVSDYYAYCAYGDSLVGKLADGFIRYSEKQGRPWLILYVCGDNGWKLNEHGMISKFLHYDNDLNNPVIVVSSDKKAFPPGKVVKDFTCFVDMAPTFLAAAGVDISKPEYQYLDGRDLAKTATGALRPRDYIIAEPTWVTGPRAVIRTHDYKFAMRIRAYNGNAILQDTAGNNLDWALTADLKDVEPVLFDLRVDPDEIHNVAFDPYYRPVSDAMRTKLQNIVLGDGRVEVAWGKQGDGGPAKFSNFAPGADDGRLDLPALAPVTPPHCAATGAAPAQPTFLPGEDPRPAGETWRLVPDFSDEFGAPAVDSSKWYTTMKPWGDRAWTPDNVFQTNGILHIRATYEPHTSKGERFFYKLGILQSLKKTTYGYFEARVKGCSKFPGLCPAFWLYSHGKEATDLNSQCPKITYSEIDIFEIQQGLWHPEFKRAVGPNHIDLNLHTRIINAEGKEIWQRPNSLPDVCRHGWEAPWNPKDDFHVYGCENTPEKITWFIDGKPVAEEKNLYWHLPMSVTFTMELRPPLIKWAGEEGRLPVPEASTPDGFPTEMLVDYVRSWQHK